MIKLMEPLCQQNDMMHHTMAFWKIVSISFFSACEQVKLGLLKFVERQSDSLR
jgi:hypothetical protein